MRDGPRPSGIRLVYERALELERAGHDIIHLEIGRPHLGSPESAINAAVEALQAGAVHYTPNRGVPELRKAIAERSGREMEEVIVTAGGSEAVAATVLALMRPGDEAIVLDPAWPHYDGHVRLAGGVPVHVPCRAEEEFQPDPERVAAAVTPRTRLLVVSSPSNPSGAVIKHENVAALAALCRERDLIALSDEIYASFLYDGAQHHSIALEPEMAERTVIADSCSKTWSMTGWRVGWAIAPPVVADAINVVHQHLSVCAPAFAQAGAIVALRLGGGHTQAMLHEYGQRRRTVLAELSGLDSVRLAPPAGAFYAFPLLNTPGLTGAQAALRLLEEVGVAVVPGGAFGEEFSDHIRVSYAVSGDDLAEGLSRLSRFLADPGS
jgi:aspartate/methionine/tyrosine aminotransferase